MNSWLHDFVTCRLSHLFLSYVSLVPCLEIIHFWTGTGDPSTSKKEVLQVLLQALICAVF